MAIRTTLVLMVLLAAGTACTPTVTQPDGPAGPDALAQVGPWKLQGATDAQGRPIPAVLTNGTATKPAPTAPAQLDAISHVLLLASTVELLMGSSRISRC